MYIEMLKGKIHRATVTQAELDYVGSITVDETLMEAAEIREYEQVQIVDIDNGQRFETYVIAGEKDSGLIAGITVRAEILLEEAENVLTAPSSALLQKDDGSLCVQKVENGQIKEVPVEIGVEGDILVELLPLEEGSLKEGDSIVISASSMYADGMTVMPMMQ